MKTWNEKAPKDVIEKTLKALNENGIGAKLAASASEAMTIVLAMIPEGAEVFTMTSATLDDIGISKAINDSGKYNGVRTTLFAMDPKTQGRQQRKLGAAPDIAVGSVHAVTESGTLMIASRTGSQLPAYSFGGGKVIWVVGAQKIVKDVEEGMRRINEYLIQEESARAIKAHGLPADFQTFPSKVLLFNRETQRGRAWLIMVDEVIGI